MKSANLIYNALSFPSQGNNIRFIPIKTEVSLHIMRGINEFMSAKSKGNETNC